MGYRETDEPALTVRLVRLWKKDQATDRMLSFNNAGYNRPEEANVRALVIDYELGKLQEFSPEDFDKIASSEIYKTYIEKREAYAQELIDKSFKKPDLKDDFPYAFPIKPSAANIPSPSYLTP